MDIQNSAKDDILESISTFQSFLDSSVNNLQETLDFLHEIPVFIVNFIKAVDTFCVLAKVSKRQYFAIIVYLTQYCSAYELYKNTNSHHQVEEVIFEIKRCICKRLKSLLNNADSIFERNDDPSVGSFLNLMDVALDKIAEIDVKKEMALVQCDFNTAHSVIEEILCLSMSVAHVSFPEDNKIITAGCRSVLNTLENLKVEINQENPNIAMCNLITDTCTDALCALEAKVNTAVLRICLNVFSEYKKPIKNLYDPCKDIHKPDLDKAIMLFVADFDLHMDRIFQISLFSVASSTIGKRVADIKNVIANLEFLEGELVPGVLSMTKDHLLYRKLFANVLKHSWCTQVKLLRTTVHGIIEPSAYCKLVYEELKDNVETMWQLIAAGNNMQKSMLDPFLNYTEELGQMITACMDSFDSSVKCDVKKQVKIVYNVMNELKASRELLLNEDCEKPNEVSNQKIFKRCQVLVTTIKQLWFSTIEEECQKNQIRNDEDKRNKTITKSHSVVKSTINQDNPVLENIITKSKLQVKDRSMCMFNQTVTLNRTLKENAIRELNKKKLNYTTKTTNLRDRSYRHGKCIEEEYNNITILEKLLPHMEKTFKNDNIITTKTTVKITSNANN